MWREHVRSIYNRPRNSFETDNDYDDYLEEIEDKVLLLSSKDPADKQGQQNLLKKMKADR